MNSFSINTVNVCDDSKLTSTPKLYDKQAGVTRRNINYLQFIDFTGGIVRS